MDIPSIDISGTEEETVAKQIIDALEKNGIFRIVNICDVDFELLLKCSQWFFKLPDRTKKQVTKKYWNPINNNVYRGYSPIIEGNPPFMKECFDFGQNFGEEKLKISYLFENSVWPEEEDGFPFKDHMEKYFQIMHEKALKIIRLFEIGMCLNQNEVGQDFLLDTCSSLRLLYYPERKHILNKHIVSGEKAIALDEHTDTNFITLLANFDYCGLEVLSRDGNWSEVVPTPNSLIVNIGDLFTKMTGGRFKATIHRVMDTGVERYSVPFFLEPTFHSNVTRNRLDKTGILHGSEESYGKWVNALRQDKKFFEYQGLSDEPNI